MVRRVEKYLGIRPHSGLSMYRNPNLQGVAACQNLESGKTAVSVLYS